MIKDCRWASGYAQTPIKIYISQSAVRHQSATHLSLCLLCVAFSPKSSTVKSIVNSLSPLPSSQACMCVVVQIIEPKPSCKSKASSGVSLCSLCNAGITPVCVNEDSKRPRLPVGFPVRRPVSRPSVPPVVFFIPAQPHHRSYCRNQCLFPSPPSSWLLPDTSPPLAVELRHQYRSGWRIDHQPIDVGWPRTFPK